MLLKSEGKIDFFIVGVQKAATSSLMESLKGCQEVYMPPEEKNYFLTASLMVRGRKELSEISNKSLSKVVGLKCPDYFSSNRALERIFKYNPLAKIIIIYRDPVDRLISALFWYMQIGLLPVKPPDFYVEKLINNDFVEGSPCWQLLDYGFYGRHMKSLANYFSQERILVLSQEEFKKMPGRCVSKIFEFLEVDGEVGINTGSKKKSIYNPLRLRIYSFFNRRFFYKFYLDEGQWVSDTRSAFMRSFYYFWRVIDRVMFCHIWKDRMDVSPALRLKLYDLYSEDYADFLEVVRRKNE
jgi:hypothetical protein